MFLDALDYDGSGFPSSVGALVPEAITDAGMRFLPENCPMPFAQKFGD